MQSDNPLFSMSNVLESVCHVAEHSNMMRSIVHYIAPSERFRDTYCFEDRFVEATRVLEKYPSRIPVICERSRSGTTEPLPHDPKKKFLIPRDMTIGQFVYVIRRRMKLAPEIAIFMFLVKENSNGTFSKTLAPSAHTIDAVYSRYRNKDHFLYTEISGENCFG